MLPYSLNYFKFFSFHNHTGYLDLLLVIDGLNIQRIYTRYND